ncbi:MAG: FecR domain-containing protein [Rhodocyclales bacterium]|nr:FecR domain-containing protein [Rhodocyclales bacterium]
MIRKLTGLLLLLASSLALAVPAAYVHEMSGSGSATTKGQSRALAVGGLLESGDVISVAKGTMTVKFEDGQIVVLQENSRFAIEKYDYNKQKVAESSVAMSLLSGGMRFITGVIGGTRKDAIAMKAGTATIGIRGTDLAINIAGVNYVVTVQDGGIVLSLPGQPAASLNPGQGAAGATNQPVQPRPVIQLSAAQIAAVAPTVAKAVPATNPVGVTQQATLVATVEKATNLAKAAQAPGATDAQKAEAAAAAQQVQQAIVASLQATQAAIQTALTAGAPQTTATGTAPKAATQPGVTPQRAAQSDVQQIVTTVNAALPPAQQLNPQQINQIQQQIAPTLSTQPTTTSTTTPTTTQPLTTEQQQILQQQDTTIQQILTPPPITQPPTCGTSCA